MTKAERVAIALLVLGTVLVAWANLAGGRFQRCEYRTNHLGVVECHQPVRESQLDRTNGP